MLSRETVLRQVGVNCLAYEWGRDWTLAEADDVRVCIMRLEHKRVDEGPPSEENQRVLEVAVAATDSVR